MVGKLARLVHDPFSNKFSTTYGIITEQSSLDFGFARLCFADSSKQKIHILGSPVVNSSEDGLKEIFIHNENDDSINSTEDYLMVIVPSVYELETDAKKIVTGDSNNTILIMHPSDVIYVTKHLGGEKITLTATVIDDLLFLE